MVLIWLLFSTVTIAVLIYYLFLAPILDNLLHAVPNEPPVARYYILLFGYILNSIKTPYEFFHWLHQKYGDRCIISFASSRYIFLNDQATFMNCIVKDPAFTLNPLDKLTCRIGGVRWECIRNKEAQSALLQEHQELLSGQELLVLNHKTCDYLIKRLTEDQLSSSSFKIVNLFDNFDEIIFNTTITVLYGETFAQSQPDLHSSFRIFNSVAGTLMFNVPFKSFFLRSAIRKRDQFVQRFIDLKPNDDMSKRVSALIELMESLNHGTIFNERDRAGCHAMLIWGAMVNTVPIVCWSLVDLLIRPDALKAVKDELTAKVTSIASLDEKETLDELHILDSCIQETMRRILPSITHREASENVTVTCSDGTQMGVRKSDIVAYPACIKYFDSKVGLNVFFSFLADDFYK
jgi:hypothetical protein